MARSPNSEIFSPDTIDIVHVCNRVVRRAFLLGDDSVSQKNYDHRKEWIEQLIERFARFFGLDVLTYAILSNHFHAVLRSRPDVVKDWRDEEVATRWLSICPPRKDRKGRPKPIRNSDIQSITSKPEKLQELRRRLSSISWWMRLLCQRIAQRANKEDDAKGKFWESRFKATRLCDDAAIVACSAYVDLNPIRAALAEQIEQSDHSAIGQRCEAQRMSDSTDGKPPTEQRPDRHLAPLTIDEKHDPLGPHPSSTGFRCSDKGFLYMSHEQYLELLHWTADHTVNGKPQLSTGETLPVLEKLKIDAEFWLTMCIAFDDIFTSFAATNAQTMQKVHRYNSDREATLSRSATMMLNAKNPKA